MEKSFACNFAVARFLPYPETEEFVNIGVVLLCPRLGYFNYKLETRRRDRVTNFFPELKPELFTMGRKWLNDELTRIRRLFGDKRKGDTRQLLLDTGIPYYQQIFRELTRPREAIFRFNGISTSMAADPEAELQRLFNHFVERQFAQHVDYHEKVMTQRLAKFFEEHHVVGYTERKLGDEDYHVTMPFVYGDTNKRDGIRAVKPLDLARVDSTRIIEHGDRWVLRVKRLQEKDYNPERFLFTVRSPRAEPQKQKHAADICQRLRELRAHVVTNTDKDQILSFVR